jgi:hypothetical protein
MMLTTQWVEQTQIQYDGRAFHDERAMTGKSREPFGMRFGAGIYYRL